MSKSTAGGSFIQKINTPKDNDDWDADTISTKNSKMPPVELTFPDVITHDDDSWELGNPTQKPPEPQKPESSPPLHDKIPESYPQLPEKLPESLELPEILVKAEPDDPIPSDESVEEVPPTPIPCKPITTGKPCLRNLKRAIKQQVPTILDDSDTDSDSGHSLGSDPLLNISDNRKQPQFKDWINRMYDNIVATFKGLPELKTTDPIDRIVVQILSQREESVGEIVVRNQRAFNKYVECDDVVSEPQQSIVIAAAAPKEEVSEVVAQEPNPPVVEPVPAPQTKEPEDLHPSTHDQCLIGLEKDTSLLDFGVRRYNIAKQKPSCITEIETIGDKYVFDQRYETTTFYHLANLVLTTLIEEKLDGDTGWNQSSDDDNSIVSKAFCILNIPKDTSSVSEYEKLVAIMLSLSNNDKDIIKDKFLTQLQLYSGWADQQLNPGLAAGLVQQQFTLIADDRFAIGMMLYMNQAKLLNFTIPPKITSKHKENFKQEVEKAKKFFNGSVDAKTEFNEQCFPDDNSNSIITPIMNAFQSYTSAPDKDKPKKFEKFWKLITCGDCESGYGDRFYTANLVNTTLGAKNAWKYCMPIIFGSQDEFIKYLSGYGKSNNNQFADFSAILERAKSFNESTHSTFSTQHLMRIYYGRQGDDSTSEECHLSSPMVVKKVTNAIDAISDIENKTEEHLYNTVFFDLLGNSSEEIYNNLCAFLVLCRLLSRPRARPMLFKIQKKVPRLAVIIDVTLGIMKANANSDKPSIATSLRIVEECAKILWFPGNNNTPMIAFVCKQKPEPTFVLRWTEDPAPILSGDKAKASYSAFIQSFKEHFIPDVETLEEEEQVFVERREEQKERVQDQLRWSTFFAGLFKPQPR
jgi:hypothetical protein